MSAREQILERLQRARPAAPTALPDIAAYYQGHRRDEGSRARIDRFTAAMQASHAEVHVTDSASWPARLAGLMASKGLLNLLVGTDATDAARLAPAANGAFEIVRYDATQPGFRQTLFESIAAGLSRARSGIAETGSLVLWPGPQEPRLLSLVPPVHFVLMDASALHVDLHAAMAAEGWSRGMPTNALLISGPSKTADIQQVLAYGAHGPRELIVLLCDDAGLMR